MALVSLFAFGALLGVGVMHQDTWPFIVGVAGGLVVGYDLIHHLNDPHKGNSK